MALQPTATLTVGAPTRLSSYPPGYPVTVPIGYTAEQLLELEQERDRLAQDVVQRYQVHDWVAINQFVSLSWPDWLNLSPIERRAIGMCVEKVASERQRKQREYEERIKSQMETLSSRLKFPVEPHSHVADLLRR